MEELGGRSGEMLGPSCRRFWLQSSRCIRSFRRPQGAISSPPHSVPFRDRSVADLWKAAGFTLTVVGVSFTGGVIWAYESAESAKRAVRSMSLSERVKRWERGGRDKTEPPKNLRELWERTSPGQRLVWALIVANVGVYLLWKVAPPEFMYRHFSSTFFGTRLLSPMLTSQFSHAALLHLGMNMYVLHSFGPQTADRFLGKEIFLALFLSGGMAGSMASHTFRAFTRTPSYALGASAAVLSCLVYACSRMPESRLQIVFLPFFDFSAQTAVYGIIALDVLGLIFRWRMFDHAAHLGGALFGLFFAHWGEDKLHQLSPQIRRAWLRLRPDGSQ